MNNPNSKNDPFTHYVVAGLGFGDEGKGTTVDYLCHKYRIHTVIRYNGGAQAGHNVVTPDGRHHTFSQMGAGTFHPGVRTHLSPHVLFNPLNFFAEVDGLRRIGIRDALQRFTVDRDTKVITPFLRAANRARERERGDERHGSCGEGIGETANFALEHPDFTIRCGDFETAQTVNFKLSKQREWLLETFGEHVDEAKTVEMLATAYSAYTSMADRLPMVDEDYVSGVLVRYPCVFEGAQGVLLDEKYGLHPYTTWSNCTFENAFELLAPTDAPVVRVGVTRSYGTRHGPGPFPTEDPSLTGLLAEPHNGHGEWQGAFRVGHYDSVLAQYAIEVLGGIDYLSVTHTDQNLDEVQIADRYSFGSEFETVYALPPPHLSNPSMLTEQLFKAVPEYITQAVSADAISDVLGVPVLIRSQGPTYNDKVFKPAIKV